MPTAELRRAVRLIVLASVLFGAFVGTIHALLTDPQELQP